MKVSKYLSPFNLIVLSLLMTTLFLNAAGPEKEKPNVIIVITDDQGMGDLAGQKMMAVETITTYFPSPAPGEFFGITEPEGVVEITIKTKSAIITTGGYGNNTEMLKKYVANYHDTITYDGPPSNTGDGIQMAMVLLFVIARTSTPPGHRGHLNLRTDTSRRTSVRSQKKRQDSRPCYVEMHRKHPRRHHPHLGSRIIRD